MDLRRGRTEALPARGAVSYAEGRLPASAGTCARGVHLCAHAGARTHRSPRLASLARLFLNSLPPPPFITLRIVCFMPPFHVLCLSSRLSPECQDPFIKPHFWGDGVRGTKPPRQIHTPPPEEGRPFFRGANRKLQGALTMPSSVSRRTSYFQWIRGSFAKGEALRR